MTELPPALASLSSLLPPGEAMAGLMMPMRGNPSPESIAIVEGLPVSSALRALAWLYLDELERAHNLCQAMPDATGAAIHAIVHRREGDFGNALYWWRQAGEHPALQSLDPIRLTKAVRDGDRSEASVERQRAEWSALADWCAA